MNPKLKFMWIDDDEARKRSSLVLEKLLGISMEFVNLRSKFLRNELDGILSRPPPDLVLLDHRLDRVAESLIPKGSITTGSTVAEIIREKWLECPIVCVTAVEIEEVALHKREIYEDVFRYSNMSQYYSTLLAIAHSFRLMKKNRPQNLNDLLNLLKAPMNDRVRLTEIAPKELKGEFEDKGILLSISRWVRHILMARPGFLYDRLWAATLLGIKERSFGKIAGMFEKAKYTGIFSDSNFPLWWKSKMQEILYKKDPNLQHLPTRQLGQKLKRITKRDVSVCYSCEEPLPEIVAFLDESSPRREAMHLRCTIPHPRFNQLLFFDEIRIMRGAE